MLYNTAITLTELKELLHYNQDTGIFTWIKGSRRKPDGSNAGTVCQGYIRISLNKNLYAAHRLAWFYHYGVWPNDQLDHKDLNRSNNRISNLRECWYFENIYNQSKKPGKSGLYGARIDRNNNKWCSTIKVNKVKIWLGYFPSGEHASLAYLTAFIERSKEFTPEHIKVEYKRLLDLLSPSLLV